MLRYMQFCKNLNYYNFNVSILINIDSLCYSKEEASDCTYNARLHRKEDIIKPFENEASLAREIGLKLVGIEKIVLESPYYRQLLNSDTCGSKYGYGPPSKCGRNFWLLSSCNRKRQKLLHTHLFNS